MTGRPSAAELLTAVAEFLDTEVRAATDGQVAFRARVAANVVRLVEREITDTAGPGADAAPAELGFADESALAAAIRTGAFDDRGPQLTAVLRRLVGARLAVDHPGYQRE